MFVKRKSWFAKKDKSSITKRKPVSPNILLPTPIKISFHMLETSKIMLSIMILSKQLTNWLLTALKILPSIAKAKILASPALRKLPSLTSPTTSASPAITTNIIAFMSINVWMRRKRTPIHRRQLIGWTSDCINFDYRLLFFVTAINDI